MEKRMGVIAKTGESCPATGRWKVLEDPSFEEIIHEGSEMPPFKGRSVSWEFRGN